MLHWWKNVFRQYFTFPSGERNGVFFLLALIVLSLFFPLVSRLLTSSKPVDFSTFKKEIDSFETEMKASDDSLTNEAPTLYQLDRDKKESSLEATSANLFNFDPNTASEDDFHRLGLSTRLIKTILNYRQKGGKFFEKEDFKKIYGMKEEDYQQLEPYIHIVEAPAAKNKEVDETTKSTGNTSVAPVIIEINNADSLQLVSLSGIGPVLTSRIIKYRNKLGGFYSTEQLKEVYGLKPETFDEIVSRITVDVNKLKKININEVSDAELKLHPYFKSIAVPLVNYREQHGNFKSEEDLKNVDVISEDLLHKIAPYLEY